MLAILQTNTPIVIFNQIVVTLLTICFLYQVVFFIIGALRGEVAPPKAKKLHRYAFFIAAHNEEAVIANLVRSIKDQDYPSELIEVFVVADACTDNTAQLAREAGAIVYERNDLARKGKSWVMDFGFDRILDEYPDTFEGYFIFDADNVISRDYVSKMNDAFDQGFHVVTSYSNSKNFGSSWISAANATWYLQDVLRRLGFGLPHLRERYRRHARVAVPYADRGYPVHHVLRYSRYSHRLCAGGVL